MTNATQTSYYGAGVDTERQEIALGRMLPHLRKTWEPGAAAAPILDIGFFGSVIDIGGGTGLCIATDGVGSKALIAQMMHKYDTIGIDCVAMNVNDLICLGARPLSMVDYIAVQDANPDMLEEISVGLARGAIEAGITVSGGETAQLPDIIMGFADGFGFDLVGTAVGTVPIDEIIVGRDLAAGDVIIGIESNGVHSNGLTLARKVLFDEGGFDVGSRFDELEHTLGEELLRPTYIYVREALELFDRHLPVKALVHITSDGFLNLARLQSELSYVITDLPDVPPIFSLIQQIGNISVGEMFAVFNMGIGFCVIVSPPHASEVLSVAQSEGKNAMVIGHVVADRVKEVSVEPYGLRGKGKTFDRI